jgi:catechol 2,3-dioxygenase-like lactoylglutathione lyase family enzyme
VLSVQPANNIAEDFAMALTNCNPVTFLFTRDREKAKAFYMDVLGLTFVGSDQFADRFDLNGISLRVVPIPDHTPSPHTVLGWDVADMEKTAAALKSKGVEFQIYPGFGQDENGIWSAPDRSAKIAWFLDVDGNNLSITQHG